MAETRYGPPEWPPPTPTNRNIPQPRGPHRAGDYPPTSAPWYGSAPAHDPAAPPDSPAPYGAGYRPAPPQSPLRGPNSAYRPSPTYGPAPTHDPAAGRGYSPTHTRHTGGRHDTEEWRTAQGPARPKPATGRSRRLGGSRWHWLLLIPIVLPLMPGLYNRIDPTLFGLPFFYWSQLGFAFVASVVIAIVHLKVR